MIKLAHYQSPRGEYSLLKGIPVAHRHSPEVESMLAEGAYRVRYRGPRRPTSTGQSTCLAADATSFAIYRRK